MSDMTDYAVNGYYGNHQKAFYSSPVWLAQEAGDYLRRNGYGTPTRCKMSRGYSVKIQVHMGAEFIIKFAEDARKCLVVDKVEVN